MSIYTIAYRVVSKCRYSRIWGGLVRLIDLYHGRWIRSSCTTVAENTLFSQARGELPLSIVLECLCLSVSEWGSRQEVSTYTIADRAVSKYHRSQGFQGPLIFTMVGGVDHPSQPWRRLACKARLKRKLQSSGIMECMCLGEQIWDRLKGIVPIKNPGVTSPSEPGWVEQEEIPTYLITCWAGGKGRCL